MSTHDDDEPCVVIARDGTTIATCRGLEDALRINRTTPRAWRVLRVRDGAAMTVPLGGREVGHFENLADGIAERKT